MTTVKTDLLSLAERCEKATGPDRDLDAKISRAIGGYSETKSAYAPEPFTASIDAATTLVPEGWGIANWSDNAAGCTGLSLGVFGDNRTAPGFGKGRALALCAAALRAKAGGDAPSSKATGDHHES